MKNYRRGLLLILAYLFSACGHSESEKPPEGLVVPPTSLPALHAKYQKHWTLINLGSSVVPFADTHTLVIGGNQISRGRECLRDLDRTTVAVTTFVTVLSADTFRIDATVTKTKNGCTAQLRAGNYHLQIGGLGINVDRDTHVESFYRDPDFK